MKKLPTFFIVGAQKAGTTSLHEWLIQQPDVCLPKIKETHFFSHIKRYKLGINWYLRQFPHQTYGSVVGEIDPEYMFCPETPLRIRKWIASPKIIFILRNPLARALSHYLMSLRRGYESLSFHDALLAEKERLSKTDNIFALEHLSYILRGKYCDQIAHYREIFTGNNFLFVKFDELISNETGYNTYEKICRFIGLKSSPILSDRNRRSNVASTSRFLFLRNLLYKPSFLRRFISKLIPSYNLRMRLWIIFDRINQKPSKKKVNYSDFAVPTDIINEMRKEIENLKKISGLDLNDWINDLKDIKSKNTSNIFIPNSSDLY